MVISKVPNDLGQGKVPGTFCGSRRGTNFESVLRNSTNARSTRLVTFTSMARYWIFDLDGTLIDSYPLYKSVFDEVGLRFEVKLTSEAWKDLPHLILPKFLEKYFPVEDYNSAFNMVIERNIARQNEIEVYAGVPEILAHLQGAGCLLSLCTARELRTAKGILKAKNLERYFGQIVTRDCVSKTKPHPEGIEKLMASTKTSVHETLMIGDHRMDIEAARGAGVGAVGVSWSQFAHEEIASSSDHHFKSVDDFHRWVTAKVPVFEGLR
jgi:phosphoglycolate phosphatase-like HAD superfamily hydrolase